LPLLTPFLRDLEQLAWQVAREVWPPGLLQRRGLVNAIRALSEQYNDPGRSGRLPPMDRSVAPAKLLFFTLSDLPKLFYPLQELNRSRERGPLRVLDLGAGYGAQTLALLALLDRPGHGGRELSIDAVDQDPQALDLLKRLVTDCPQVTGCGAHTTLSTSTHRISAANPGIQAGSGAYDLIVAGGLLNELDPAERAPLARGLLKVLSPSGKLILIEPALRQTTRSLHTLRDDLLSDGAARVVAPCTRQGPCPALDDPRDWCYERRPHDPPPLLRQLTRATGLRRASIKWSYVTLSTGAAPAPAAGLYRVVSKPLKSKGKLELFLCGAQGRLRAVRLKRHRSPANSALDRLDRGRLALIDPAPETSEVTVRIERETRVEARDPASTGLELD
jgi:ribosomal protein RSM22 (predicted rRNA methylase)